MIGKLLCCVGRHKLAALRVDYNTLNGGRPSGALYECKRCGQIQEWFAAWDMAVCANKWKSKEDYLSRHNSVLTQPDIV